jgi:N-acetylmuramoyl-L-alanine amidase
MNDLELIDGLSPLHTVAATIFGEARGQGAVGRAAVASVIQNRVRSHQRYFGLTPKAVCLQPHQFSCWLPSGGRANYETTMDAARSFHKGDIVGPITSECLALAELVMDGLLVDIVGGACWYLTRGLAESDDCPAWAKHLRVAVVFGDHVFLKGK